ncbi:hypothetical protein AHAS_Ahas17G0196700 [Arachis hypogaea]|uniref:FAR1 domain-containing protein n=1 Tax=Arachis hypogaea TaxID=3818 RepID=A0A445CD39_ARAHY|nr:hypothetical protein Ahy_A07g034950 [Arachis hypogaea]
MKKVFHSDDVAYEFYKRFGKCHGFGINKGECGKHDKGRLIRRRFFCNRAGLKELKHYNRLDQWREHKLETRTNCEAKLSIYCNVVSGIWKVKKNFLEHNHV